MRYYRCINCGLFGDFKRERKRGLRCQECSHDLISEITKEEYETTAKIRKIWNEKQKRSAYK